ncbi:MAG: exodeoxyribonuclease VII small subunit [Ardenticatenaceae bacterium]|nr:exodeoxyribonuclease VII small subunit [Anaerolineales bacterium]MCB8982459.1 exodeoxyribonuclease VII small subunit [Ardenticatenaceae bacterium]
METEKDLQSLSFEEALQELELIVARLEDGELTLDESLALFERGQKLAERCNKQLSQATLRIEQLTADGEIVELPSP